MSFKELGKCLSVKEQTKAKDIILKLYDKYRDDFKTNLLVSNLLIDPYNNKADIDVINILMNISYEIEEQIEALAKDLRDICIVYDIIYTNNKINSEEMMQNKFLSLPLDFQLDIIAEYLEIILMNLANQSDKIIKQQNIYTGFEHFQEILKNGDFSSSIKTQSEMVINALTILVSFLYYNEKNQLHIENKMNIDIRDYIKDIDNIFQLAGEREFLEEIWNDCKYKSFSFEDGTIINNVGNEILNNCGNFRTEYRESIRFTDNLKFIQDLYGISINKIKSIKDIFIIKKNEFLKYSGAIKLTIDSTIDILSESIDVEKYIDKLDTCIKGYEYISTIALIISLSDNRNKFTDTRKIIIEKEFVIEHIQKILNVDYQEAKNILELYIFKGERGTEIFERPLINIDKERILLSYSLIVQINLRRKIEILLKQLYSNNELSKKGTYLERKIKMELNGITNVNVIKEKLKFEAYDNKPVEFDFLALVDNDKIFMIEMKNVFVPYESNQYYTAMNDINEGIEQIARRKKVIIRDWDKIKSKVTSFKLPEKISEENIWGCVLTNVFNFTGLNIDGVPVIDISLLCKYFNDPNVKTIIYKNNDKIVRKRKIRKENTIIFDKLKEYIINPTIVRDYEKNAKQIVREHPNKDNGRKTLRVTDNIIENNIILNRVKEENSYVTSSKIGRNELCSCGSGKKYKKCCGK